MLPYIIFFMLFSPIFLESSNATTKSSSKSHILVPNATPLTEIETLDSKAKNDARKLSVHKTPKMFMPDTLSLVQSNPTITVSTSADNDDMVSGFLSSEVKNKPTTNSFCSSSSDEKASISDPFALLAKCKRLAEKRHSQSDPDGKRKSLSTNSQYHKNTPILDFDDSFSDREKEDYHQNAQNYLENANAEMKLFEEENHHQGVEDKINEANTALANFKIQTNLLRVLAATPPTSPVKSKLAPCPLQEQKSS